MSDHYKAEAGYNYGAMPVWGVVTENDCLLVTTGCEDEATARRTAMAMNLCHGAPDAMLVSLAEAECNLIVILNANKQLLDEHDLMRNFLTELHASPVLPGGLRERISKLLLEVNEE